MAFESVYWRAQIKRDIRFLRKKLEIRVDNLNSDKLDYVFSQIEIKLFTITYAFRKLMDTRRLPDKIGMARIKVKKYKRNNKKNIIPWHGFEDYYDLASNSADSLTLRKICNQFIHSYWFQPIGNSKGYIRTVFFVSNDLKEKYLFSINLKYFLSQLEKHIEKYPRSISYTYDAKKGEYIVKTS